MQDNYRVIKDELSFGGKTYQITICLKGTPKLKNGQDATERDILERILSLYLSGDLQQKIPTKTIADASVKERTRTDEVTRYFKSKVERALYEFSETEDNADRVTNEELQEAFAEGFLTLRDVLEPFSFLIGKEKVQEILNDYENAAYS